MKTIAQTHPLIKELKHLQEENKRLKAALKRLLDDAEDREETKDDDGVEYLDWREARLALEQAEYKGEPTGQTYRHEDKNR